MNFLGPRDTISKSVLVDILSEIWHNCLSSSNIISGFRARGIYPINREKYPQDRFDQRLLKRYKDWVDFGRPEDIKEELSTAMNKPQKGKLPSSLNETAASDIEATAKVINEINNGNVEFMAQQINHELEAPSDLSIVQKHTMKPSCSSTQQLQSELRCYCAELGPMPANIPGKIWVPAWTLQENKSFSELVLDKMKGPTNKPPTKRRKVDRKTAVISDPEYAEKLRKIKEKEESKKQKEPMKTKSCARKKINYQASESSESEIEIESESENKLTEDEDFRERNEATEKSTKNIDIELSLQSLWKSISPPTKEEDILQQWYGCIYQEYKLKGSKKQALFVAKATRRFLSDENGKAYALEMKSLKLKIGSGTILKSVPQHLGRDISVYSLYNVIAGPLEVIPMKNNKWNISAYESVNKVFSKCEKIDRENIFNRI